MKIRLGYSTCPNDTFMFHAMTHGLVDTAGITFEVVLADIHLLNGMAMRGELDMVKVSYNAYGQMRDRYALLEAGSAMGQGCGPLLIARQQEPIASLLARNASVAIPGRQTTANLLLSYFAPGLSDRREMLFHDVMPAVLRGDADLGLIIHENRFTYAEHGLVCIQDLGEYWEQQTGLPIPLGAITARHTLGEDTIRTLDRIMHDSVAYAFAHPDASAAYVRAHAQEMSQEVCAAHIHLYVNQFSLGMGEAGHRAVDTLLAVGSQLAHDATLSTTPNPSQP